MYIALEKKTNKYAYLHEILHNAKGKQPRKFPLCKARQFFQRNGVKAEFTLPCVD